MKALLLNSGVGKRMGELTRDKPKCLVPLNGDETILSHQVKVLLDNDIHEIIVTTGPFPGQIQGYLKDSFPGNSFIYVPNPLYQETNYIYSMFLARDYVDGDLILMHGDLVFDPSLLRRTLDSPHANTVLLNFAAELPGKDFKARLQEGRIREISVHIFGKDCHFLIPLYKLTRDFSRKWFSEIDKFAKAGNLTVYAEDALNHILAKNHLCPVYFSDELCSEIDNEEDLETIRRALPWPQV